MSYWLGTVSGKRIDLLEPDPEQITIEDIAHALSNINRFNGHTTGRWSVLQHSIAVARLVAQPYKLQAILHDATEAYICDIPSPLKHLLGDTYRNVEKNLAWAIGRAFGVDLIDLHPCVKQADAIMLMTEHERMQRGALEWEVDYANGLRAPVSIFDQGNSTTEFIRYVRSLQANESVLAF